MRKGKSEEVDETLEPSIKEADSFDAECKPAKQLFSVTVQFIVRTNDIDMAEDLVADLVTDAVAEFGDNYAPDAVVTDFEISDIEPTEL
jgi:hypothetical protein